MRRFTLLMPLFMQLFMLRILLLSPRSLRPVLLYRRSDLFQVAVSLTLAASEGVLVDLERVAEDALRDRGNERVVLVVECIFGLDDMSGEQHLELFSLGEGGQGMLPLDGAARTPRTPLPWPRRSRESGTAWR